MLHLPFDNILALPQVNLFDILQPDYQYDVTVFSAMTNLPWQYVNCYTGITRTSYINETFNKTGQFAYVLRGFGSGASLVLRDQQIIFQGYNSGLGKSWGK